jgi:outer membrane protein insertion porin family
VGDAISHIAFRKTLLLSGCLLWMILFNSCSSTRGLKPDEYLLTGSTMSVQDPENIVEIENFDLETQLLLPKGTQAGLFNIYLGLYNIYDSTGTRGFKNWVKNTLGKAPVIFNDQMLVNTEAKLAYYLKGKGYFSSISDCDTTGNDQKVALHCTSTLGKRYTIDSLIFPSDSTYAALKLDSITQRTILKEGSYYDRSRLLYERSRLTSLAVNNGFADFSEENVFYYVDTNLVDNKVDVYLQILQPTDSTVHTRYTLDSIQIYTNHVLDSGRKTQLKVSKIDDQIQVYEQDPYIKHSLLNRMILENTGELYNKNNQDLTVRRLLDLGLFRYVNIKNRSGDSGKEGSLVQDIFLTPENMQSISGEFELNNRSGNFFGTGASVSYTHRNLFSGGERLRITLGGLLEAQIGDQLSFINSADLNLTGTLSLPRFVLPFFKVQEGRNFIPRTLITTNITYQRRIQYYTLNSNLIKYGFSWRETRTKNHELYPIVINQIRVSDKTAEFDTLLMQDPRLERSFENVFIAGLQYYYTYNNQSGKRDRNYQYLRGELETSGNLINAFANGSAENRSEIFNNPFAQFSKITFDFRNYFAAGNGDLATRIILGSGFSYGNGLEIPYIKQYFIGGSNSLRAFRLRGLGPGSFVQDPDEIDAFTEQFIDQTGDIKLEMNVEYRFPVFNYIKGALFLEGGNIWLINDDDRPEGNFSFNDFYKQLGIGTGFGVRFDFNFFLFRLDIAFPLRSPEFGEGFNWRFSEIDFFDSAWRSEYLRYNIGIGYPF